MPSRRPAAAKADARSTARSTTRSSAAPPVTPPATPPATPTAPTAGPAFVPVRTRRAFESVCDQIRLQVADGSLRAGQRLPPEKDLAEQFGVGRIVVREALRSLEVAGVVQSRPGLNGGVFITSGGSDGVTQAVRDMVALGQIPTDHVTEARIELTCVAIRLACRRATPAELDAIDADIDYHAELFRQGRGSRNTHKLGEFYRLLARATHNEVIVMLVDALSEIVRTMLARIDPQPRADIVAVRRKVLRLVRAGDADRACATMSLHFKHLNDYLESQQKVRAAEGVGVAEAAVMRTAPARPTSRVRR